LTVREKYSRLPPLPPDIKRRLAVLTGVVGHHPVGLLYLFGSAARDPATAEDIDLAVLPGEGFSLTDFCADLSLALGIDRLDIVDLRRAPVWLQWEVVTTGRPVFSASPAVRQTFERAVRARYRDERSRLLRAGIIFHRGSPVSLRREFIWSALAELRRIAAELEKHRGLGPEELGANLTFRWAVERGLLAGLSLIFEVADHILTRHFGRAVETDEGLLSELRACGVISESLYRRLKGAAGFRNIPVHGYLQVDLDRVARALKDSPDVFRTFGEEVGARLNSPPEDGADESDLSAFREG
jgi:uncharacterized protein YutE (UPF0331/DUF86 family)/predicted nucleotidyltransferase